MASTYLTRTQSSDTSNTNFTFSCWIKRSNLGNQCIYATQVGSDEVRFEFDSNDKLFCYKYNGSSFQWNLYTKRRFMDTAAFYHIVLQYDSTQSTASDRLKLYINGTQETDFQSGYENYPGSNDNSFAFQGGTAYIGCTENTNQHFDGIMTHINMVHGTTPVFSAFGSTDNTTGEWTINTSPSVTYGTQGYFILKDGNSITDQSPNTNNWSVGGGSLVNTKECPDNIYNAMNRNFPSTSTTLSNGGTTLTSGSTQWNGTATHIPLFSGKWYYECQYINGGNIKLSIMGKKADLRNFKTLNNAYGEYHDNGYGYQFNDSGNDYLGNNASSPNWGGGLSSNTGNKYFMVAINLDNGKIWYGADGTWFNDASGYTGNPSTDAYPHQTISSTHLAQTPFIVTCSREGNSDISHYNFGGGYFGTTAVSTNSGDGYSDVDGNGKFNYSVPTNFRAICTKGLNQ